MVVETKMTVIVPILSLTPRVTRIRLASPIGSEGSELLVLVSPFSLFPFRLFFSVPCRGVLWNREAG